MAVVEGITEFLPISSTAHLMFTASILKISQTEFVKSFEIAIQAGAIFSIVSIYAKKVQKNPLILEKIFLAFLPTGLAGLIFYKFVKSYLLGNDLIAISAMFLGGIFLLKSTFGRSVETERKEITQLSTDKLFMIGVFQSLAMVPGVSRSLATIVGGQMAGLSQQEAVELSFLLAVPTMLFAVGWDLVKTGSNLSNDQWGILALGFGMAFVTARVAVLWMLSYVQKRNLKIFGWYRILISVVWLGVTFFQ